MSRRYELLWLSPALEKMTALGQEAKDGSDKHARKKVVDSAYGHQEEE